MAKPALLVVALAAEACTDEELEDEEDPANFDVTGDDDKVTSIEEAEGVTECDVHEDD